MAFFISGSALVMQPALAADYASLPIVPAINASMKANLQTILARGQALGNRPSAFAKIGDSITESGSFLADFGCGGDQTLGATPELAATINFFSQTRFPLTYSGTWCVDADHPQNSNSFTRGSVSAVAGWTAGYALDPSHFDHSLDGVCPAPYNTPLRCEYHLLHPSLALMMYGTNDLEASADPVANGFRDQLTAVVNQTIADGVIPLLSTLPARTDSSIMASRVDAYNRTIVDVANAANIPVWNFSRALQGLPNQGISSDGVHPSVYGGDKAADLSNAGLQFGYNVRNLIALQTLAKVKQVVLDNGAADPGGPSVGPVPAVTPPVVAPPVVTPPVVSPSPAAAPTAPVSPVSSPSNSVSLTGNGLQYDIGQPTLRDIWIDPVHGDDSHSGATRAQALQTVAAAWQLIPMSQTLSTGYRLLLVPGAYSASNLPNYMESRYGTYQHPIIIQAADGRGTVVLQNELNVYDTRYFYLFDVNITPLPAADTFHCEKCDHLLLRGDAFNGGNRGAYDGIKVNQSQYLYFEDIDVSGASHNGMDMVAIQYGHIVRSKIHNAAEWCFYNKGGSAQLRLEQNELYNCDLGGYTAGQGTGFEFMTPPWIHYEAYDIKFVNNVVHDTGLTGIGVNGGYNILIAHNTFYRIGAHDHLIEFNLGRRSCDGRTATCQANHDLGGWGTTGGEEQYIPNKNIYVYNNVFYNPAGYVSPNVLQVSRPGTPPAGSNLPSRSLADDNIQFKGNVIWNQGGDLGLADDTGCLPSNPNCNAREIEQDNAINASEPQFMDPAHGDFRLTDHSNVPATRTFVIPAFPGNDAPAAPTVPGGNLSNTVSVDRANIARTSIVAGAYASNQGAGNAPTSPTPTVTTPAAPQTNPMAGPETGTGPSTPASSNPSPDASQSNPDQNGAPSDSNDTAQISVGLFATPFPSFSQGQSVSYRVTVSNHSAVAARNVIVSLPTPDNATLLSVTTDHGNCQVNDGASCSLGTIPANQNAIATIVFRGEQAGSLTMTAHVDSDNAISDDPNHDTHLTLMVLPPDQPNIVASWTHINLRCRAHGSQPHCAVSGQLRLRNISSVATRPAGLQLLISSTADRPSTNEHPLRHLGLSGLRPNHERIINLNLNLPAGEHHGQYLIASLSGSITGTFNYQLP